MSLGKNIPHDSAKTHVTGESVFIDDRPRTQGELYLAIVGAPIAKGRLLKIDGKKALQREGVLAIMTAKDLQYNKWGTIEKSQPILVEDEIGYRDEPVCLVVAETAQALLQIEKDIIIEVEEQRPILSLEQSIDEKMFLGEKRVIARGDAIGELKKAPHRLKGTLKNEGQEHFYLESHACIAYPLENNQIEIHSSSQHPTETQHVVAHALGLKYHQVVCVVKRMGGGFGGKESQAAPLAALAGLAAQRFKRPARLILTKDQDMKITGKRHPFRSFYEVGFDDQGKVLSHQVTLYSDGGAYADLSYSILERAMLHSDGCYYLPHVRIEGQVCQTNNHPHTAFRGFGGPQGNLVIEHVLDDIAYYLKLDPAAVKRANIYDGDKCITPYGQKIDHNPLPEIFDQLMDRCSYVERRQAIEEFNKNDGAYIKGMSISGTKFGIAFTARFLNQGNALVNIHVDGTVQVSTGATEMGQGVNTKIQQIVSGALGVRPEYVQIMPTSTEKNHNTSPTAASSGSDLNGGAALKSCENLVKRLKAIVLWIENKGMPKGMDEIDINPFLDLDMNYLIFEDEKIKNIKSGQDYCYFEVVSLAYMHRISLGEYAHYKITDLNFDKEKGEGKAFNYFTNGLAVSEVLIDRFTGEMKVLRSDIFMDLGRRINPGVDNGQVTGAFVQAMGWATSEKLIYSDRGELLSHGPTTYKIPSIQDTPREFNVYFMDHDFNTNNVVRSKAVGEPPFLLGVSVWHAVKDALSYLPGEDLVSINLPITGEDILTKMRERLGY